MSTWTADSCDFFVGGFSWMPAEEDFTSLAANMASERTNVSGTSAGSHDTEKGAEA